MTRRGPWEIADLGPVSGRCYRFVMKLSRQTAAVVLASALVLTACTGDGDAPEGASTPATAGTTPEDQAATAGPDDDAATTSAGPQAGGSADDASSTTAMTTDPARAAMSVEDAETAATTVLQARQAAVRANGKKQRAAAKKAYMSSARTAAAAADKLEGVTGKPAEAKAKEAAAANVLAISRADGELPILLLVQTVPDQKQAPVLHLMESRTGEAKDFRIAWEAPMLPGTTVPTFDRRSVGTPVLRGGQTADLKESPKETLREFRSYISWPQPEEVPSFRSHGYSPAVRKAAEQQAAAVADQADMREKNWIVMDDLRTLLFEDGSAFITGTLLRETTFTVKPNSVLSPPETFTTFADDSELTDEAVLRTMVFLGMRVPAKEMDFKRELIAVQEQLVDAWGS